MGGCKVVPSPPPWCILDPRTTDAKKTWVLRPRHNFLVKQQTTTCSSSISVPLHPRGMGVLVGESPTLFCKATTNIPLGDMTTEVVTSCVALRFFETDAKPTSAGDEERPPWCQLGTHLLQEMST